MKPISSHSNIKMLELKNSCINITETIFESECSNIQKYLERKYKINMKFGKFTYNTKQLIQKFENIK